MTDRRPHILMNLERMFVLEDGCVHYLDTISGRSYVQKPDGSWKMLGSFLDDEIDVENMSRREIERITASWHSNISINWQQEGF